jgi:hypothetical protein
MALFFGQTVGALVFGTLIGVADYRVAFWVAAVGVGVLAWWARR